MNKQDKQEYLELLMILQKGTALMFKQWEKTVEKFMREYEKVIKKIAKGEDKK